MTTSVLSLSVAAGCIAWSAQPEANQEAALAQYAARMAAQEAPADDAAAVEDIDVDEPALAEAMHGRPAPNAIDGVVESEIAQMLVDHLPDPEVARVAAEQALGQAGTPRMRKLEEDLLHRLESIRRPRQFRLTLAECVARALANSFAIQVESFEPAIETARLVEAEAAFDAIFFANYTNDEQDRPSSAPQLTGTSTKTRRFISGLRQPLVTGGQVQASYSLSRTESNLVFQTLNPSWFNNYVLDFRQPLLRGFGLDVNRAQIELRKVDREISRAQFRQQVRETLNQVEQAYWDLLAARRQVVIDAQLLRHFEQLYGTLKARGRFDAIPVQITQAESRVLLQDSAFIATVNRVKDAEDRLKSLLNDPTLTLGNDETELIPVDALALESPIIRHSIYPVLAAKRDRLAALDREYEELQETLENLLAQQPVLEDRAERVQAIEEQLAEINRQRRRVQDRFEAEMNEVQLAELQTGLDHREELKSARLQVSTARIFAGIAKNQALPRFDLTVRYTVNGLGANSDRAFNQLNTLDFEEWFVGVEFEWPLGNRAALAALRQSNLRRSQAEAAVRRAVEEIILDISTTLRDLKLNFEQVGPSLAAVRSSDENIRATLARAEDRSPAQVNVEISSYDTLANSRAGLLRALVNFNVALSNLERAKGTLLHYNNVTLAD